MTYGSVVNMVVSDSGSPELGGPATLLHWSDRSPATVIGIVLFKSGPNRGKPRVVRVQEDSWKVVSGSSHDGSAVYAFERDGNGAVHEFKWTGARWAGGGGIAFGYRDKHIDPSF